MMREGRDPVFIVAYIREELRRDPGAFDTPWQSVARTVTGIFEAYKRAFQAFVPALRAATESFNKIDYALAADKDGKA